jgi:hypothetical protein
MSIAEQLRDRAIHMMAMAMNAYARGDSEFGESLLAKAGRYLDEVAAAEPPEQLPAPEPQRPTAQQTQQPQPRKEE